MTARAVVFDFYGTLSVSASRAERREGAARIAAALGASPEALHDAIATTFTERATGACGNLEETMRWLAERCGCTPTDEEVQDACGERRATEAIFARAIRPDAEPTLRALRERGVKIGVLSDCTHELPEVWPSLLLARYVDVTVFSVECGLRKPHPDLYAKVADSLRVPPSECVYVGDGGSGELSGAVRAGMTAFHLRPPDANDAIIYDAESAWRGPVIDALSKIVAVFDE